MLFKIAWRNVLSRKLTSFLCVLLMALGIGLISFILLVSNQLQDRFSKNSRGIDMVVGAKGSPLQLILSSVYQIDNPTGNVPLAAVQQLGRNPLVKQLIPLSMGDNVKGYRIVGTTPAYLNHFEAKLASGRVMEAPLEVVVGATAAAKLGFKLGDEFHSSHGLDGEGDHHDHAHFKVVGILQPTHSVADLLVITTLESVWAMHEHGENQTADSSRAITSALVKFRSPMGLMTIPRTINENTVMQAALPSIEINRLFELLGIGQQTLQALALLIMLIAGISVFVSLYNALKERKYELALMLTMGGQRLQLFGMLLLEGLLLGLAGFVVGIGLSRLAVLAFASSWGNNWTLSNLAIGWQPSDWWLLVGALGISVLAALLPSLSIYRLNISKTLASE